MMAFYANFPYAQAPGMGLNAFLPLPLYLVWATHGRKLWEWSSFVV